MFSDFCLSLLTNDSYQNINVLAKRRTNIYKNIEIFNNMDKIKDYIYVLSVVTNEMVKQLEKECE